MVTELTRNPVIKRIVIDGAIVLALLIQFGGTIWFAAKLDARVQALETWAMKNESSVQSVDVVKESLRNFQSSLDRVERTLEQHRDDSVRKK